MIVFYFIINKICSKEEVFLLCLFVVSEWLSVNVFYLSDEDDDEVFGIVDIYIFFLSIYYLFICRYSVKEWMNEWKKDREIYI
jgi:hypothetical protein